MRTGKSSSVQEKKMNLNSYLTPYNNLRWIVELNVKARTRKLLYICTGIYIHNLDKTQKALAIKGKKTEKL